MTEFITYGSQLTIYFYRKKALVKDTRAKFTHRKLYIFEYISVSVLIARFIRSLYFWSLLGGFLRR